MSFTSTWTDITQILRSDFHPIFIFKNDSYQNAVKSTVGSPVFVVAFAMGVSFVCLPAQRCACELTSDGVGRCGELRKDLFLTLP